MNNQIDPNEITAQNAGKDWLELKAAALSLQLHGKIEKTRWRLLLAANALLLAALLGAIWMPVLLVYTTVAAIMIWIASVLFVLGTVIVPRMSRCDVAGISRLLRGRGKS